MQEHQASLAAGISSLQPELAGLLRQVISNSADIDVKAQRRADALAAASSIAEALRLLPASGEPGLDGQAAALTEAASQQLSAMGPSPGKVCSRGSLQHLMHDDHDCILLHCALSL